MTITTLDAYIASAKQNIRWTKTGARTTIAQTWYSAFDVAGNPGAGTLAIGNTANGLVPTDATAGYPTIDAFGGGATGYLTKLQFTSSVACRIALYDRVFAAGAYAFNASVTLASQPSYLGRIPGGTALDCAGRTEIWVEQVTAATGNQAVEVLYNDENGNSSTTGAVGIGAAPAVGRCWQLPLAAGDRGVSQINQVIGTVASAGTFNVMVLRMLGTYRVNAVGFGDVLDLMRTGMPRVYADSAIYALISTDSTALGLPDLLIQVANG